MSGNDDEIKVALVADSSDLEEGVESATESVVEGSQTMSDAVAESSAAMSKSYEDVIAAQNRSMAQTSALIAAQAQASAAAASNTTSIEGQTAATAELGVVSGGVARELGVLTGEALRGNFVRMEGSVVTLANRLGLMQAVFSPLGALIAATAGSAALFVDEIYKGEEQSNAFNKALDQTGGYLGITEGQFNDMAKAIQSSETTIGTAREAMMDMAQTGRFQGDAMEEAGKAAVDFAALTGESMQQAVAQIVKLQEDPVKAVTALNDQYHFLTLAELEHIQQLEEEGDKTAAASEAIKAFQTATTERLAQADQDVGTLVTWWRNLKGAISDAADEVQAFGRNQTLEEQITQLQKQISDTKSGYTTLIDAFGRKVEVFNPFHPMVADTSLLEEKLAELQKQAGDNRLAAAQKATAQATQDAGVAAEQTNDKMLAGMKGTTEYTKALNDELAALKQIHEANADDSRLQGIDFDKNGDATGGEGLQKIETYLHKKYDLKAQGAANEHKLDEQELEQEEADQQVSNQAKLQFELNFWQQKLSAATKGTQEYASAYRSLEEVQKQIDDQRTAAAAKAEKQILELRLQSIDEAKKAYDADTENQKKAADLQYQQGTISASQLLAVTKSLIEQQYAADVDYVQRKLALDQLAGAQGVADAAKESAQITALKQKETSDLLQADQKYEQDSEKEWKQASDRIAGSFQTAFNSIVFQGQKTQQALASVAESIGETLIQVAIEKPLQRWVEAEAAKLAAALHTTTAVATANETQTAADLATSKATAAQYVASAVGVAGAQGVASFSGAPWPVDMGAPAFGASMAAAAASFGSVASAAGGWDNVPADQMAQIHKNEMILPAHIADFVRQGASAAGSGSQGAAGSMSQNIHVHANDAKSFEQMLQRDPRAFAKAAKRAHTVSRNRR